MGDTFAHLVEEIKKLSSDEKEELIHLLKKLITEARRDEIYENFKQSMQEVKEGDIKYSGNLDDIRKNID